MCNDIPPRGAVFVSLLIIYNLRTYASRDSPERRGAGLEVSISIHTTGLENKKLVQTI